LEIVSVGMYHGQEGANLENKPKKLLYPF
jgi:hypothetical protein